MKVALIGLSGTGKSSVGEGLARRLGWDFVDTDDEVVRVAGKPIHAIFEDDGEAAFRRLECEAVQRALGGDRRVVSLGGGAVMDPANQRALDGCTVVLLEAGIDTMLERLQADMTEPRPMLDVGVEDRGTPSILPLPLGEGQDEGGPRPPQSPRERIDALRAARDSVYRRLAHVVVSTDGVDIEGAIGRVAAAVQELIHQAQSYPHRNPLPNGEGASRTPLLGGERARATLTIRAAAGEYRVLVGRGLLERAGELLREAGLVGRVRLIADATVHDRHGSRLEAAVRGAGFQVASHLVTPGEASKSLETASSLYDWLLETGAERRDFVMAMGGGVVGDLAGFVAATYLRGLRLVQLPTTLLAQVDSSVGGKVAVNHPLGKNLIGAFYPPSLVIADTDTLSTLPRRDLSAALAEVVKHGVILDGGLFSAIETQGERLLQADALALDPIVVRSIQIKAEVVEQDEKESGLRAILNYGHTIGHAVEAVTEFDRYRHGEAVAIGMVGAAQIAVEMGMMPVDEAIRQRDLLGRLGLPVACPGLSVGRLLDAMGHDKKAAEGKLSWVLPETIGRVSLRRDVPAELVARVLERLSG